MCSIALMGAFGVGIAFIFPTIALSSYQDETNPILDKPLTDEEGSWFGKI